MSTNRKNILNCKRKNRKKSIRVIFQVIFLTIVIGLFCRVVFHTEKYVEPNKDMWASQKGFVALAFPGISLTQQSTKITKEQLGKYLNLLHEAGYISISQQDIINYIKKLKPLPEKAIFILFDSGAKDSIQFVQPLLEKYQYIATCLTYAEKLEEMDPYFIQFKDTQEMKKSGFWEFGTNGYRLMYINVFDKSLKFFPYLNQNEFKAKDKSKYYNHYLMDFLRNEDMIPVETRKEMMERINYDYNEMAKVYEEAFEFIPQLYTLMNSNSGYYGSNKLVGEVNYANIQQFFKMNFNREGSGLNTVSDNIYDLTRLLVKPDWYTNHFIMRFKLDTKDDMQFVLGDKNRSKKWEVIDGASEFIGNRIILTSPYKRTGLISLRDSENFNDFSINVTIPDNITGKQSIYLKYDKNAVSFIKVSILENKISIEQKTPGSLEITSIFGQQLDEVVNGSKYIKLSLNNNHFTLSVNDKILAEGIKVDKTINKGAIVLSSEYNVNGENDKISDSVFDDLYISEVASQNKDQRILYDNRFSSYEKTINAIKLYCGFIVNWFIEKL